MRGTSKHRLERLRLRRPDFPTQKSHVRTVRIHARNRGDRAVQFFFKSNRGLHLEKTSFVLMQKIAHLRASPHAHNATDGRSGHINWEVRTLCRNRPDTEGKRGEGDHKTAGMVMVHRPVSSLENAGEGRRVLSVEGVQIKLLQPKRPQ